MATTKKKTTKKKTTKKAAPKPEPEVVVAEEPIAEPVPSARMLRVGRGVPRGIRRTQLKRWAKEQGQDLKTTFRKYL